MRLARCYTEFIILNNDLSVISQWPRRFLLFKHFLCTDVRLAHLYISYRSKKKKKYRQKRIGKKLKHPVLSNRVDANTQIFHDKNFVRLLACFMVFTVAEYFRSLHINIPQTIANDRSFEWERELQRKMLSIYALLNRRICFCLYQKLSFGRNKIQSKHISVKITMVHQ